MAKKKNKIEVKSICIQLPDGSSLSVSIEDAKELYEQLSVLFSEPLVVPQLPVVIERERMPWSEPSPWRKETEPYRNPIIWCSENPLSIGEPKPLKANEVQS